MLEDLRFLSNEILSSFEVFAEVELRIPLFCDYVRTRMWETGSRTFRTA
jgi:hypothetical protein